MIRRGPKVDKKHRIYNIIIIARLCVVCLAVLLLVGGGHVDTGQWSMPSDDVMHDTSGGQFIPVFQPTPRNISVSLGDRAVLRCRVDNLGTRAVSSQQFYTLNRHNSAFHPSGVGE